MKALHIVPILTAAILVGSGVLILGEKSSRLERPASPYPEVAPTLSMPPERPPEATLSGWAGSSVPAAPVQTGLPIGQVWLYGGTPTEENPLDEVEWPRSLPVDSRAVTLEIDSASPPVHILLRFRREPRAGLALDAIEQDCWQRGWTADGAIPTCVFEQRPDGQATILNFDLPPEPGPWYLTVEAIWLAPVDGQSAEEPLLPIWRAWWAFSVTVKEAEPANTADKRVVERRSSVGVGGWAAH